ncbi:MAG: hypothetical protein ABR968_04580 [Bacteroidales bacterium]|jgi:hypothetical protein
MKKKISFILTVILFYSACKPDFNPNTSWKDITVVYGLLSPNDTVHYVKINKAFLGQGNALVMAQNPDSCTYGNNLTVWVEEWNGSNRTNLWYLDTTTIYNKESGTFYYPKQVIYKFKAKLDTIDAGVDYRLYIKNNKTGKLVSGHTGLVQKFDVLKPLPSSSLHQVVVNFTGPNYVRMVWNPSYYGRLYQLDILFTYREKNILTNDSVVKTLDWNLGTRTSAGTSGNDPSLEIDIPGVSFYTFLQGNITASPNMVRTVAGYPLRYVFSAGADNLNTYIEVNAPSTSVVQDRPGFTNIVNGLGIFSSRYQEIQPHYLDAYSSDSLLYGHYTKNLNFQ